MENGSVPNATRSAGERQRRPTSSGSTSGGPLHRLLRDPASPEGWRDFVDHYGPKIYAWCRRWGLQDADAQDVTQAVLAKLVRKMGSFVYDPSKGSFRGLLKTITDNACKDILEDRSKSPGARGGRDSVVQLIESPQSRKQLVDVLAEAEVFEEAKARVQLRVQQRDWEIFCALAFEEQTGKEVAAKYGVRVASVFVIKQRVKNRLAKEVERLQQGFGYYDEE